MMIKTGTVMQDTIVKVEFDENSEIITEKKIVAKRRDYLDTEEFEHDVQNCAVGQ
ncbi:MAG: hypothetical protein PHS33_08995 [Candidatus Omnitrophica bacterium]|nr:hypothetical protein [Candidatus Omnitrophota bacterium]